MVFAYAKTRDAIHPMMLICPMFAYMYVLRPTLIADLLPAYFPRGQLETVAFVNFLGVAAFCLACCYQIKNAKAHRAQFSLAEDSRYKVHRLAMFLGFAGVVAFWYCVFESGGLWEIYSHKKGFLRASSGYLGEAPMLTFPAIVLLALSRNGFGIRLQDVGYALVFASPHLIHGILGARRGPTFLVFATLIFAWYISANRRPTLPKVMTGLAATFLLVFIIISHRHQIYLGSDIEFSSQSVIERAFPTKIYYGDDYLFGSGMICVANNTDRYYWGARVFATVVVRPIPRQIWPNKYEALGLGWMQKSEKGSMVGFTPEEWANAVGWTPSSGSSGGMIADLFVEFSWLSIIAFAGVGMLYGFVWRKATTVGGVWIVIFLELLILTIYIPTQSFSAVLHRSLFMAIPTLIFWRFGLGSLRSGQRQNVRRIFYGRHITQQEFDPPDIREKYEKNRTMTDRN